MKCEIQKEIDFSRILVAEDDFSTRALISDLFTRRGYDVIVAEDGVQALQIAENIPVDVVLLDVMMPKLDGLQVCTRIKQNSKTNHIPVIIITVMSEQSNINEGLASGANDYITKPFNNQDLMLRVQNAIITKKLFDKLLISINKQKDLESHRDNLTRMIIHDLRSPLTVVLASLQLLKKHLDNNIDLECEQYLKHAFAHVEEQMELINSLLDVDRLENQQLPLNKSYVNLSAMVADVTKSFELLLHSIKCETFLEKEDVIIKGDFNILRRVMSNLLGNAIKFTPPCGMISIKVSCRNNFAVIQVTDSGTGIPIEYHEKIFDKYCQLELSGRHHKHSSGLGLTFCKLAVEAHGGKIGVISEAHKGATFWIQLPLANEASFVQMSK